MVKNQNTHKNSPKFPQIPLQQHPNPMALRTPNRWNNDPSATAKLKLPETSLGAGSVRPRTALARARVKTFNVETLAAAVQNCKPDDVFQYLHAYDQYEVERSLQDTFVGNEFPIMFFAISRNDEQVVRQLLSFSDRGAMANARTKSGIPPLAFAVLYGALNAVNTLTVFKVLLANGADPECVPRDMWDFDSILKRPQNVRPKNLKITAAAVWCDSTFRDLLAQHLDVSQRYFLWQASLQQAPSKRRQQVLSVHNMDGLVELPYHLVGQQPSTRLLESYVFAHIVNQRDKPLVIVFAGPSGHGKTELAQHLGTVLGNLPTTIIDCTQMRSVMDLFGPSIGYDGYKDGSRLNNHLTTHSGKRSIVFLDEFEKMGAEARLGLLRILDAGTYHDRKTNADIDTRPTIFVLATNSCSYKIENWYERNLKNKTGKDIADADLEDLASDIRQGLTFQWEAATVGRCRLIIPFLPFNEVERAVIAHSFILKFKAQLRAPINIEKKHLVGHIDLALFEDEKIVSLLGYIGSLSALGARTIEDNVIARVQNKLTDVWSDHNTDIDESVNAGPLAKYVVQVARGTTGKEVIDVFEDGTTEIYD